MGRSHKQRGARGVWAEHIVLGAVGGRFVRLPADEAPPSRAVRSRGKERSQWQTRAPASR